MNHKIITHKLQLGKDVLEIQTENLADQAAGSCLAKLGDTSVLCTAQSGEERGGLGFLPLTCDYEERFYAAGKILGSRFVRREGRPSTAAVLITRLIDRAIRPLFPKDFSLDTQVIATCLSWDGDNDPGVIGLLGSSLALSISNIPWQGPLGAVRVGKNKDGFILNPNYDERDDGFDLVVAGVEKNKEIIINMIEFQGGETSEEDIVKATEFALPYIKEIIDFQKGLAKKIGKEKMIVAKQEKDKQLEEATKKLLKDLKKAMFLSEKQKRNEAMEELKGKLIKETGENFGQEKIKEALDIFEAEKEIVLKEEILKNEKRPDGRGPKEVRKITADVGVIARSHGSAMFSRGETRALSILTLGAPGDQQLLESMEIRGKKRFLHHYNFPPYSVGEVRPLRGPGRREIGHGMLAEKALSPLIPDFEKFPYTIRVVSEMLASNGSTSMASVSAVSLALMDGGVPILRPAAGIAIGLVSNEQGDYKLLTDIQGPEDYYGEMDFKVAGSEIGITAIQMDVKIKGISVKIIKEALERAKAARLEILEIQNKTIDKPRQELSKYAPRVYSININPQKIGAVIGSGGKVINEIIEDCKVQIDIEESGQIFITAEEDSAAKKAISWIENLTREAKVGEIFQAKVKRLMDFGAIVDLFPGQEGMVHISEFADFRVEKTEDVVKVGEIIPVRVINIDEHGRIKLSAKDAGFKPGAGTNRFPNRSSIRSPFRNRQDLPKTAGKNFFRKRR